MYYFLTAHYDVHDLVLHDNTSLCGPFKTPQERDSALEGMIETNSWDDEDMCVSVTLLEIVDGRLSRTASWVISADDYDEDEDEDDYDEEE